MFLQMSSRSLETSVQTPSKLPEGDCKTLMQFDLPDPTLMLPPRQTASDIKTNWASILGEYC